MQSIDSTGVESSGTVSRKARLRPGSGRSVIDRARSCDKVARSQIRYRGEHRLASKRITRAGAKLIGAKWLDSGAGNMSAGEDNSRISILELVSEQW